MDHRPVGADPDGPSPLEGWGEIAALAEDRLGLGLARRLQPTALLGDPAVELAPPDREAPELGGRLDRLLVAQLGDKPAGALPNPEGVGRPRLESEGRVEGHDLDSAAGAAVAPTPELDLAGEGHEAAWRPAIRLHRPTAGGAGGRRHEIGLEASLELSPERAVDLGEGDGHRPLERADVGMLRRQVDLERHRTLHREPLRLRVVAAA